MGKLERAFPHDVVVIGVHSAKYPAEADPDNLRDAVQRYGIHHPVVNDPEYRIWDAYTVKAWPTLVFISPAGEVIGSHSGEVPFEALAEVVQGLLAGHRPAGASKPEAHAREATPSRGSGPLLYPGKLLVSGDHLFIADSGNHRVIHTDLEGQERAVIGCGLPGAGDGTYASSRFLNPQGMALDTMNHVLYVADADNHTIRAVDLEREIVRTIAGTGQQARRVVRRGPALGTPLSSPWDLVLRNDALYVAMAGLHQVWMLDLPSASLSVWAGTGHEALKDGPRESAWLAQPMGLSLSDDSLYVSCAEAQAIRRIDLTSGEATTVVGRGLFAFGDTDGVPAEALLQHNQDVEWVGNTLFVADTYNNKIKVISAGGAEITSIAGSGRRGVLDGPGNNARFAQPAGLGATATALYVADTDNHLIRTYDFETGVVRTLHLSVHPQ